MCNKQNYIKISKCFAKGTVTFVTNTHKQNVVVPTKIHKTQPNFKHWPPVSFKMADKTLNQSDFPKGLWDGEVIKVKL